MTKNNKKIGMMLINNLKKIKDKKGKVDMTLDLSFNEITITVGEKASQKQIDNVKIAKMINYKRCDIGHIDIFELKIWNLGCKIEQGSELDVYVSMDRMYMQDLQRDVEVFLLLL
jgi:hypothetical protein